ncbi:hypothetical protein OV450_1413 [Actinobacteria bacterium OV450]|nr:hypothetical protein OV450_1413 [Actinobacteria bacterium OV450]
MTQVFPDYPQPPIKIEEIRKAADAHDLAVIEARRDGRPYKTGQTISPTPHTLHFTWGANIDVPLLPGQDPDTRWEGVDVCEIISDSALHIPAPGDLIRIHGVRVRVLDRIVDYEISETGQTCVFATIDITPATDTRGR